MKRNVREIYAHAYQSFLWNKLASRRISRFGKEPCVGDLVLAKGEVKDEDVCEEDE
jgi:tRNA pseudouridine13 synthase